MRKKRDFQYVVIGSGPAGSAVATTLARAKKGVALIENHFFGGANLNTLDLPYSVALDFAHTYHKINTYPEFKNQDFTFNFPTIASRELQATIEAGKENTKTYEESGVICLKGYANFLDPHTIAVDSKKITADNFIIASGAHLNTTGITGIDTTSFLTPETAIKVHRLPEVIAVVGGGSTGCEITSFFAELGAKVVLLELADRILPREDIEVSSTISNYFTKKLGVSVLTGCKVVSIGQDENSKYVIFRFGTTEKMVRVTDIALATGSLPNTDLGLENAKVKYNNTAITVNKAFQTSAKNIYAIGDCIGGESSTDRAQHQGLTLATNLLKHTTTPINYQGHIRITNTPLQVATIGLNDADLLKRDIKYKKALIDLSTTTASKVRNLAYGFVKLLSDFNNRIIGATIVAPDASLLAEEISLAVRHRHTAIELASTPHPTNEYSYAVKLATRELISKKR